jgi:hypothetical protein
MKIINAFRGTGDPMTEEETENFMANNNNNLRIRIGRIDDRIIDDRIIDDRRTNCSSYSYCFDDASNTRISHHNNIFSSS